MPKKSKDPDMPPLDRALRTAFEAIENQPVPDAITDHIDQLIDGPAEPREPS
ncbi:hypothetical protein [Brevundimonas sp.]|uniref:hypothetical protein n=1 Tax=Brevundimonas sp. TaxID=1871086 RepID=UPI002D238044|nr:hypothetical protein [Brevundimonas sp.]HYC96910.1 hypothetical protein [Brevundimonas sp.]